MGRELRVVRAVGSLVIATAAAGFVVAGDAEYSVVAT
jgi:hypothetical protein